MGMLSATVTRRVKNFELGRVVSAVTRSSRYPRSEKLRHLLILIGITALAVILRVWEINAVGLNSDEAVYAGQGAAIAGEDSLAPYFPAFRAHPLFFQTLLAAGFAIDSPELFGRLASAFFGVATVLVAGATGRVLYGPRAGLITAAIMAVMPYHVVVTRQILLDGPMVFWATVALYMLSRYATTRRHHWLYAAAGGLGMAFLSKEGSIILLGAVYAFLALSPILKTRLRHVIGAGAVFGLIISAFPISLKFAGKTDTGGNFVAWQLFRRPNHDFIFYPSVVPMAIGILVVIAAGVGIWLLKRHGSWRETLLLSWIIIPIAFFQMFPVKGFQYLLPVAPAVAILAARFFVHWRPQDSPLIARIKVLERVPIVKIAIAVVIISLLIPSWNAVQPSRDLTFLAGSGGIPGGRETGTWIKQNVPVGAQMMSIGPSMANIIQFYGHRKTYGLSVSPNPLHRNPVYEAMKNPDRLIRDNELQYVVWDVFSANRSPFFSRKIIRFTERYNGHVVYSETVPVKTESGSVTHKPMITVYEVRP